MLIVYHCNNKVVEVMCLANQKIKFDCAQTISAVLMELATVFPTEKIIWCNTAYKENLALDKIDMLFYHSKLMLSFSPQPDNFFDNAIGYVEESLFINVTKKVAYPTWQMSSCVGVIHAAVLNAIGSTMVLDRDFDYFLNSVAKLAMPLGLLCYSEPQLLKNANVVASLPAASHYLLFRFVKQHFKTRWIFLLALNLFLYERKIFILALVCAFFFKRRRNDKIDLDHIEVQSSLGSLEKNTFDVIIPTIGRKHYLYDVLKDFSQQILLPTKIIIVEQNPEPRSTSDLDYLENEKWPFEIHHIFTHQTGACNARNLALRQTKSDWVFLSDDDIRINSEFTAMAIAIIKKFGIKAVSLSCLQEGELSEFKHVFQWGSFGAGCSIVANSIIKTIHFNLGYEFGYGEDSDFGMQVRNQGSDVLFLPKPSILHLKAPVGGFRTKPFLQWHNDAIQPKPAPTVMLYLLSHQTKQQILGYKTVLFFKYYKHQKNKNPFNYFVIFRKQWNQSVYWANQLKIDS